MAMNQKPNDPFDEPIEPGFKPRSQRLDEELQVDPELAEGAAGGGRIAAYALAIVLVLGAVFYGMNTFSTGPTATPTASSTANQNAAQTTTPATQPGVRDVTPYNSQPGTTTGAAPARPIAPPANAPVGTEIDRSRSGGPTTGGQAK